MTNAHPLMVVSSGGCYGGCLAGYCFTTYSALRALLGEPHHRDIDYKVNVKWNFLCQDGTSFSVYDWQESSIPKGYYWWHIGGGSPRSLEALTRMTGLPTVSHVDFHRYCDFPAVHDPVRTLARPASLSVIRTSLQ